MNLISADNEELRYQLPSLQLAVHKYKGRKKTKKKNSTRRHLFSVGGASTTL